MNRADVARHRQDPVGSGRHRQPAQRTRTTTAVRWLLFSASAVVTVVAIGGALNHVGTSSDVASDKPSVSDVAGLGTETVTPSSAASPTANSFVDKRGSIDRARKANSPSNPTPSRTPTRPRVAVPEEGTGDFTTAAVNEAGQESATSATMTYVVQIEEGLPLKSAEVAAKVDRVLADPRSWQADGVETLGRVSEPDAADIHIVLATPETADELCAPLQTEGRLSCRNGRNVVINAWRWFNGAAGYEGRIESYRTYVVNHEVGHALGNPHAVCPGEGALAPVMLQQTKSLDGCLPNPWPAAVDLQ